MSSKTSALELSSRSVRRCKKLIDAAVHEYLEILDNDKTRRRFTDLVSAVRANSNVLCPSYVAGPKSFQRIKCTLEVLKKLIGVQRFWQSEPWEWTSNDTSFVRSLRSLIEFLLVRSDVPKFLYMGWLNNQQGWDGSQRIFLHLAAGNSIRGYQTSFRMTKSMAKRFMNCPDHFSVTDAFTRARDEEYTPGQSTLLAPAYTRRRRKNQIAMRANRIARTWGHWWISDFHLVDEKLIRPWGQRTWTIKQILSEVELVAEGNRHNHCVGSYVSKCEDGETSIWAMEYRGTMTSRSAVTIEVDAGGIILRAMGKNNRSARMCELEVIATWAKQEGLRLSGYLWMNLKRMRTQNQGPNC